MLVWLADYLAQYFTGFGVVQYITVRNSHGCTNLFRDLIDFWAVDDPSSDLPSDWAVS